MAKKEMEKTENENGFSLEIRKNVEQPTSRKPMTRHSKYERYLTQIESINSNEFPLEVGIPAGINGAALTSYIKKNLSGHKVFQRQNVIRIE